jgi:Fic family protein
LPTPLPYLSAFFEASCRDYYDSLRGVSERGAWQDWIELCSKQERQNVTASIGILLCCQQSAGD